MRIRKKLLILFLGIFLVLAPLPAAGQSGHNVVLTWTDTVNPTGTTYNVYKASGACSSSTTFPSTPLNAAPLTVMTYTDSNVALGTYCYAGTAVNNIGESAKGNSAGAVVQLPATITITVTVK